jgi:phosphate acyltransferase
MGGDRGPAAVVAGLSALAKSLPGVQFILHGPEDDLNALVGRERTLQGRAIVRHAPGVVSMEDKPSSVMRNGKGTSMWSAIEAVEHGEAQAVVSCGNTGALMALSMLRLRKIEGVNRPAIACYWPSRNPQAFNVMLDVGADVKADADDLLTYAIMGSSYARNGLGVPKPRVGLLNVGTEENKGRPEMREAFDLIAARQQEGGYTYVGYVEGSDLPSARVDVIVTDGFTGNIALKTGEGTANLIREFLGQAFRATLMARLSALLAMTSLKRLQHRIDPRRANGGVFLGLNGIVVKSHGSSDPISIEAAVRLAVRLAQSGFTRRLAARVATHLSEASAAKTPKDAGTDA